LLVYKHIVGGCTVHRALDYKNLPLRIFNFQSTIIFIVILPNSHESELLIFQKTHINYEGYLEHPIIIL
jgi:hypothetical protein